MSSSRDWDELVWAWRGWRDATGRKMKKNYTDFANLMNKAAKMNGNVTNTLELSVIRPSHGSVSNIRTDSHPDTQSL